MSENNEDEEDEDVLDGDIRFEMYSPEEEEQMRTKVDKEDLQAVAKRHNFASEKPSENGNKGLFGGMTDFLSKKRQDCVENITGFFNKLDEMEKRLKVSQDRIEKEIEEEQKAEVAKEELGYKMTQAIR